MRSIIKKLPVIFVLLIMVLLISSCAPGNEKYEEKEAGFLSGLWHGIISPISLIWGAFNSAVSMYEVRNTGGWYNLGFLLGILFFWGGCRRGHMQYACRRRHFVLRDELNCGKKLRLLDWQNLKKAKRKRNLRKSKKKTKKKSSKKKKK